MLDYQKYEFGSPIMIFGGRTFVSMGELSIMSKFFKLTENNESFDLFSSVQLFVSVFKFIGLHRCDLVDNGISFRDTLWK